MKWTAFVLSLGLAAGPLGAIAAHPGDEAAPEAPPLAAFERLVGERWHFGDTYQVYEWGVGKRAVRARAYSPSADGPALVSEGFWYYQPESQEIRGTFVAIGMGLDLFEYVTTFEGDTMTSRLTVHGPEGRAEYVETLEFRDDDHYAWALWRETPEGREEVMAGDYERRREDATSDGKR